MVTIKNRAIQSYLTNLFDSTTERGCPSRSSHYVSNSWKPTEALTVLPPAAAGTAALRSRGAGSPVVALALVFGMVLFAGCTPAGPRALLRGQKLIEQGKYSQAIETLTNATPLLRTNAQFWNYVGLAHHYNGNISEAELAYHHALALDRDLSEARYNLGCLWLEQNKPDLARTELTAFTLRRGNSAEGFLKLGTAQLGTASTAAEKSFEAALRLNPQNPEALNGVGWIRYQQRRFADAQRSFASALKQQPDYAPAMLNLAILAQQHFKDNPGALKGYRQYLALKPRPENADAVAAIVRQLEQEANPAPVSAPMAVPIQSTIAATVKDSKVVHAPTNTSSTPSKPLVLPTNPIAAPPRISNSPTVVAAPSNGVKPAAAAARSPTNGPKEIAQTHVPKEAPATDGVQTAADARYHYKKPAKPVSGNRSEAQRLFGQGEQAHQAHRLPEAVIAYRTATQLDPGFFEAHYNLGLAATEAGNLQVALTAYENALAIVPNSLDARYNFALVLKQAGFLFDAENELEKLLDKYPNEARGHLALANLCAQKLQDLPRARQHYLKVLDIEPQHPQGDAIRHWVADHPL